MLSRLPSRIEPSAVMLGADSTSSGKEMGRRCGKSNVGAEKTVEVVREENMQQGAQAGLWAGAATPGGARWHENRCNSQGATS